MTKKEVNFETALAQLEKAVQSLEKGELTLDETIAHFEDGVKMVRICRQKLGEAEKKIEILLEKDGAISDSNQDDGGGRRSCLIWIAI